MNYEEVLKRAKAYGKLKDALNSCSEETRREVMRELEEEGELGSSVKL